VGTRSSPRPRPSSGSDICSTTATLRTPC